MKNFSLTACVWREDGAYVSQCPELGVASCGDTPGEALDMLKEAVDLYIDNAIQLGIWEEHSPTDLYNYRFNALN